MDLSGLFLKPEAGALCRFPLSSAAIHGRDVHGRIQCNYFFFLPLFFLVLPMALESRLSNRTVDPGLCSWISPLPRCCSSFSTVPGASAFLDSGSLTFSQHTGLSSSDPWFPKSLNLHRTCLPTPPVSEFLGNFVNLNVLRDTPAAFTHVENERLLSVI